MSENRMAYRSLFWPLVLIAVGVVWLLGNLGVLSAANLSVLARLWPVILIAIGLDLLFGRRSPALGAAIGLGAVVFVVLLMLVGPGLGWSAGVEVKTANYAEPLGDAQSARVVLRAGVSEVTLRPLTDSSNLFEADLTYIGDLTYDVAGGAQRMITLAQRGAVQTSFNNAFGLFNPSAQLKWDVRLNPAVPLALEVSGGVGDTRLELMDFDLTVLNVSGGVGSLQLALPGSPARYSAQISGSTGDCDVRIEEGADLSLTINGGVGDVTITLPAGAAARVNARTGVGSLNIGGGLNRVSGSDDRGVGGSGVWETPGYAAADRRIDIEFNGGVGDLTVR